MADLPSGSPAQDTIPIVERQRRLICLLNSPRRKNRMTVIREEAVQGLKSALQEAHRGRLARLAAHPWKLLYSRLLRVLGSSHSTWAKTFWNGRFTALLPEAVSTQVWRYGFFEDDVCLFILRSLGPGRVFIDIGAHFGFFTLLASEMVGEEGRVIALEPMPKTFVELTRNVTLNTKSDNVITFNSAAYSESTTLTFHDYGLVDAGMNSAFGIRKDTGTTRGSRAIEVSARTCDDLLSALHLPTIDLMKVDAESSEMHVLKGAEVLIREFGPRIILEVGDFDLPGVARSVELVEWLSRRGYVAYECSRGDIVRHQVRDTYTYGNLLFVRTEA